MLFPLLLLLLFCLYLVAMFAQIDQQKLKIVMISLFTSLSATIHHTPFQSFYLISLIFDHMHASQFGNRVALVLSCCIVIRVFVNFVVVVVSNSNWMNSRTICLVVFVVIPLFCRRFHRFVTANSHKYIVRMNNIHSTIPLIVFIPLCCLNGDRCY